MGLRGGKLKNPKVLFLDIEASNLNANFGYMLCFGYKWLGDKKAQVISITDFPKFQTDPTNDKYVTKAAAKVLTEADMWVGWYSSRYDIPFVQTRLVYHKLPLLPPVQHCDAWRIAKYKMKLNSNRLASVSSFLGVEEKTPLSGPIWVRGAAGHKPSVRYIVEHCRQDVEVLEQSYMRIRGLSTNHPHVGMMNGHEHACPNCGSDDVQRRGIARSRLSTYHRFQCMNCGAWSRDGQATSRAELR